MATIYDFETGIKSDPPVECSDGHGYPEGYREQHLDFHNISSNPFPWVRFIDEPDGGFARFQIDHENFVDIPLTAERAMGLVTDLALIATKLLRDGK